MTIQPQKLSMAVQTALGCRVTKDNSSELNIQSTRSNRNEAQPTPSIQLPAQAAEDKYQAKTGGLSGTNAGVGPNNLSSSSGVRLVRSSHNRPRRRQVLRGCILGDRRALAHLLCCAMPAGALQCSAAPQHSVRVASQRKGAATPYSACFEVTVLMQSVESVVLFTALHLATYPVFSALT
eukprot:6184484-Pleurochrysis_carterae.AAC.5